jgi:hypothetical protein
VPQARHQHATYHQWKGKYSGVQVSELQRLRELKAENAKLKPMYADLALENPACSFMTGSWQYASTCWPRSGVVTEVARRFFSSSRFPAARSAIERLKLNSAR